MPYVVPFDIFGLVFTFPLRPGLAIREFHTSFWAASLSTCHHERRIDRDTGQPSREFGPAIEAVQMNVGSHPRFLNYIFCIGVVSGDLTDSFECYM
jgi:hypothetical protein